MKLKSVKISAIILSSSLFFSCSNLNNTQKGGGIGAGAGAIIGGILGNNLGSKDNAALGAVIGAAVGGTAGAVIGKKMDKQATQISQQIPGAQVERVGEGIKVVLNENAVRFDVNKSTITTQSQNNLNNLIPVFREYPDTNIAIYGYTDSSGNADSNLKLSQSRAKSVADYLIAKGLAPNRISTKGFGIESPIADNTTVEGKAKNRRVEFAITANDEMIQDAQQGK